MPNWGEVFKELRSLPVMDGQGQSNYDVIRRKYLKEIFECNGKRNVIAYYSGWLQRPGNRDTAVNDKDISGFMACINKLDKRKGLDLILHTPGGDLAATESLVTYLKKIFNNDIRAIVPQLSMSAGTMIALSCKEIMMGKQSSLGPIDPQIEGMACEAVIHEFERARNEILDNTANAYLWEFILSKYYPTFLNSCQNAIDMANEMVKNWLKENMCNGNYELANKICRHFSSHKRSKIHGRHLSLDTCKKVGVKIVDMEANQNLQDAILTTHHAFMLTFSETGCVKIIENHSGTAFIEQLPQPLQMPIQLPFPIPQPPR